MSQMKNALFAMVIFIAFILPFLLSIVIGSIHQHAFMKVTTEFTEIVKEEGGVTEKVNDAVKKLKDRGYRISFKDENGKQVSHKQDFGNKLVIDYVYKFEDVRGIKTLNTQNMVIVSRR